MATTKRNISAPLPAKISRPRLASRVLFRKRLFSLLTERLREKAVWVSGPAGAGKTTFVNSYIEAIRVNTIWYQVDPADADPATFFHYLGTWLTATSGKAPVMPRFSPQAAYDKAAFSNIFFQEFFKQFTSPFIVVLDNFQEASGCREFVEAVSAGIRLAPPGSSFVLISRTEPVPELAGTCERGCLPVLGWDYIRLTEGESADIAQLHGCVDVNMAGIERMHSRADGWIAGLLLLIEQAKARDGALEELSRDPGGLSFDYFMAEVFDKIDPATQELLLKSSLYQDFTLKMAIDISGNGQAKEILNSMSSGNFFVARLASGCGDSYQFHPLFRDFLLKRAKAVFAASEMRELMAHAAAVSAEAGQLDCAANLFIEAQEWGGLSRFVHEHGPSYIAQGRLRALRDILKEMPESTVGSSPWLLYYYGLCRMPDSPGKAREMFEAAYAFFESAHDGKGAFLAWTGAVDTILYEWKDFTHLDRWIAEFDRLMAKYGGFPSRDIEIRATTCIFSGMMFRQPGNPALPEWEKRICALAEAVTDNSQKISITRNLILYYLWTGNVAKAGLLVERLKPTSKEAVRDPLAELMWLRSAALYRMFLCSGLPVLETVDEGLHLADKTGIHLFDNLFQGVGIYCSIALGDLAKAEAFLGRMKQDLNSEKCAGISYYYHHASIIDWCRGRLPEALEHAKLSLDLLIQSGTRINIVVYEAAYILLLIEAERFEAVRGRIDALRDYGRSIRSLLHEALGLLAEAFMSFKKGDSKAFAESFRKALALLKEQHINAVGSILNPAQLAQMCALALEHGIEPQFVKRLIRLNSLDRFSPGLCIEDWPWEIKVFTLGSFEIYSGGEKVEFSRKAQQKPLSMLKELVSAGGRPVPEGAMIDSLWPLSEGDLACTSFNTTIHRLRKLLGSENAVRHIDGMLSLEGSVWVDAWAFGQWLDRAQRASESEVDTALARAVRLYRGEYLPGEGLSSAASCRERLRGAFVKCMEKKGARHEAAGDHKKALESYRKGIDADVLAENLYVRSIACHLAAGDKKEAINTYERLRSVLSERLNIRPSKAAEDLRHAISEK